MSKSVLLFLVALATCAFASAPQPPAKRLLTHEDVWLMKRVGAPVPSPDGRWAVFTVVEPAYDPKDQIADLWLKSLGDDVPARRLTFTKSAESGVAWSPDSRRLAFSAKREGDEAAQLYLLDLAGGEAERVTALTLGARLPKWSPDGRHLLFVSEVYPEANDEAANRRAAEALKARKASVRAYDGFPPRFWDRWLDERRARLFVQEAVVGAVARDVLAGSALVRSAGFGGVQDDGGETLDAEWTPDGAAIVFAAAINRDQSAFANVRVQLFSVAVTGGEPRRLVDDGDNYSQIAFAPDGRSLLCAVSAVNDEVYSLTRLARFPWPLVAAERTVLSSRLDRSVARFAVPADSDRVYFTADSTGRERVYSVAIKGGAVREEAIFTHGSVSGLAAGGSALVGTWESVANPAEVYALPLRSGDAVRRLTHFNVERAAMLDLPAVEAFSFTSAGGRKIHNLLVRPPGFDPAKKYPLLLLIHGGAASMWKDAWVLRWNYHLLASPGYVVLLTDYTGSTGYGEAFSQAIKLDPLKTPADELNQAADAAIKRFSFVDAKRQAAAGASYGGHLANWLQATTTRYRAIVSHAGEADLMMQWGTSDSIYHRELNSGSPIWGDSKVWWEQSPALQGGNHAKGTGFTTPILITVGEQDFRVPANHAYMWFTLNQRLQVPSRLLVFPEENHWILKGENSRLWYGEVHAWLAKWLR